MKDFFCLYFHIFHKRNVFTCIMNELPSTSEGIRKKTNKTTITKMKPS